ncbi:hypothetical protein [Parafrankia sp. BMG5.11]|uniref:hypothetical protein n=1 Tax=Parafrankia sp. BMG5.11 TaxID=222540 RepID=UPI0010387F84|nr:hypothetical protein [Parafrankia sp. BMG5.11]TCJ36591.1 hypothetical protein E0504_22940 [Parafrankia sp. BMG5.11]
MSTGDDGVLEAARAIRPYLQRLVAPATAASLDHEIAHQLADTPELPAAARRLRDLLDSHEDTAWFLAEVLEDAPDYRPPYQQPHYLHRQTGGTASPAGDPGPIAAVRYACPRGDYVWYRPDVGTPIPVCRTHHVALIRT